MLKSDTSGCLASWRPQLQTVCRLSFQVNESLMNLGLSPSCWVWATWCSLYCQCTAAQRTRPPSDPPSSPPGITKLKKDHADGDISEPILINNIRQKISVELSRDKLALVLHTDKGWLLQNIWWKELIMQDVKARPNNEDIQHPIPKERALIYCFNSLHFSGKFSEPGQKNLVGKPAFHLNPKGAGCSCNHKYPPAN